MTTKQIAALISKITIERTKQRRATKSLLLAIAISVIAVISSHAAESAKEHLFRNVPDGSDPDGALVSDGAGNFYGTTLGGGMSSCGSSVPFCGIVFKMTLGSNGSWTETVIYKFKGGTDGAGPAGPLMFDSAGNLYGTTETGGNREVCSGEGCGTVFKLSPSSNGTWTESVLHSFLGSTDAAQPASGVVMDAAGNLYGSAGGGCIEECNGTIFELSPSANSTWTESILYTFLGGTDGGFPAALTLDAAGNLFSATFSGGVTNSPCGGCGTVFELSPSANGNWQKTILYNFADGLDGGFPSSGVTFDSAGNLYGETFDGGSFACPESGCGTVYRLTPASGSWKFGVIYTFNGVDGSKGSQPSGGLTIDSVGNLYGTTGTGGNLTCNNGNGCGTIFKLTDSENRFTFSKIFEFNGTTGSSPNTGVIVDASGNLYGSTFAGGNPNCNCGVVFDITP
jgi:uncharacterized repeat protein (TIGR03803 family)